MGYAVVFLLLVVLVLLVILAVYAHTVTKLSYKLDDARTTVRVLEEIRNRALGQQPDKTWVGFKENGHGKVGEARGPGVPDRTDAGPD